MVGERIAWIVWLIMNPRYPIWCVRIASMQLMSHRLWRRPQDAVWPVSMVILRPTARPLDDAAGDGGAVLHARHLRALKRFEH